MRIITHSVKETAAIGKAIAGNLEKGDIVCLFGQLGSGKTVLAKGIARGLGIDTRKVTSPTFVLIRQYANRIPLYHFDLYRLKKLADILALGCEEYFYDEGVTVIEWADRLRCFLPKEHLKVTLSVRRELERALLLEPVGKRYEERFKKIKKDLSR